MHTRLCMHTRTYIYIYIYIYMFVCVCVCVCITVRFRFLWLMANKRPWAIWCYSHYTTRIFHISQDSTDTTEYGDYQFLGDAIISGQMTTDTEHFLWIYQIIYIYIYKIKYPFTPGTYYLKHLLRVVWETMYFLNDIKLVWIQCFSSLRLIAKPRLKNPVTHTWSGVNVFIPFPILFTQPLRSGRIRNKVDFYAELTGLNSEFSFSLTSCLTKAEELSLSYYLPIAGGRIIGFIPFSSILMLCKMQSFSSRIWTRVAVFISNDYNHYTTGTHSQCYKREVNYKWHHSGFELVQARLFPTTITVTPSTVWNYSDIISTFDTQWTLPIRI